MPRNPASGTSEVLVSTAETTKEVYRLVTQGQLRKLASRLYTTNLSDAPEDIVRRNLWAIVAGFHPGALVADRTALEAQPAKDTSVCVVAANSREQVLPGLIIRPRLGVGPQPDDLPFAHGLYLSSPARAYLENMRPSRSRRGRVPRTLGTKDAEERLEKLVSRGGPESINRLRDRINQLGPILGMDPEAAALGAKIGTLLGTRDAELETSTGRARRAGQPYDAARLGLFQSLHTSLRDWAPVTRQAPPRTPAQSNLFAFFESYFSNFIEGTEFEVDEAAGIIFEGRVPLNRSDDAHDIRGTFQLAIRPPVKDPRRASPEEFADQLKRYNAEIMGARPEKNPGEFKSKANRAGATLFVEPELLQGTLLQGLALLRSLETPFHRAVFTMFLVSEIHPFADGNGRTGRILMNQELTAGGEERIIIPTVYRNNYIAALKALTHNSNPEPIIRVLDFAWRWTAAMDWNDFTVTMRQLAASNAFEEADGDGIRLRMPEPQ